MDNMNFSANVRPYYANIIILQIYKCYLIVFLLYARNQSNNMHHTPFKPTLPLFFCLSQYKTHWDQKIKYWQIYNEAIICC